MNRKITLPLLITALGILFYLSFNYIYVSATNSLITQQIETSKNQANIVANLLSEQIKQGNSKIQIKNELQKSIENTSTENSFICMFDSTGKEICHPNKEKIGQILQDNNSIIHNLSNNEVEENFKKVITTKKAIGGLRKLKSYTEIVYLSPVKNTDWVIASHANITRFQKTFNSLKERLIFLFLLIWLTSIIIIYFFLQRINKDNLQTVQLNNKKTSEKYFNELKILNKNISTTQKQIPKTNRLLADKGYQLTPVFFTNIALIYTENKISYIIEHNGEKSSINLTLDELFHSLDKNEFYRASRQVIISAKAIDKIEKYGTTQLKVSTKPITPIDIIISKAKLSDFKKWIGKN